MIKELHSDYSTISSKELLQHVIPDYEIQNLIDCVFWERGANDTYQVRCSDARYSLRIYRHNIYPRDEIDFEVDALNYLHQQGFPVAYPIARKSGAYVTEIKAPEGIRYVLVTAFIEGRTQKYETSEDSNRLGKALANMHEVMQDFKTPHKKKNIDLKYIVDDSIDVIAPYVSHRPEVLSFIQQIASDAHQSIRNTAANTMDIGFCHGDQHGFNAHWHEGVLAFYDFEECGFGYRVFDLAAFKLTFVLDDKGAEFWQAFMDGYQSVRPIQAIDLSLLDQFVVLRELWLIAFQMRNANDFGHDLTSDGYIDYFVERLHKLINLDSQKSSDE